MALNVFAKLVLKSEFGGKSTHYRHVFLPGISMLGTDYVKSCTMS